MAASASVHYSADPTCHTLTLPRLKKRRRHKVPHLLHKSKVDCTKHHATNHAPCHTKDTSVTKFHACRAQYHGATATISATPATHACRTKAQKGRRSHPHTCERKVTLMSPMPNATLAIQSPAAPGGPSAPLDPEQRQKCHACRTEVASMPPSVSLPHKGDVDVARGRACHKKVTSMSLNFMPAARRP